MARYLIGKGSVIQGKQRLGPGWVVDLDPKGDADMIAASALDPAGPWLTATDRPVGPPPQPKAPPKAPPHDDKKHDEQKHDKHDDKKGGGR